VRIRLLDSQNTYRQFTRESLVIYPDSTHLHAASKEVVQGLWCFRNGLSFSPKEIFHGFLGVALKGMKSLLELFLMRRPIIYRSLTDYLWSASALCDCNILRINGESVARSEPRKFGFREVRLNSLSIFLGGVIYLIYLSGSYR
jgi:hypothetical protein